MLDDQDLLALREFADHLRNPQALPDVQVRGGLVEEVHVRVPEDRGGDGHPLQLAPGEGGDVPVQGVGDAQPPHQRLRPPRGVHPVQEGPHRPLVVAGDLVHVLGLDGGPDGAVGDPLQVVVELRARVGIQDGVPGRLALVVPQVRDDLPAEDPEGGGLPDSVGAQEPRDLPLLGDGEAEQPERVPVKLVDQILLQLVGEVDDPQGVEGALLDADAAPDTRHLGDDGLAALPDPDDLLARPLGRAERDALLVAPVRVAPLLEEHGDAHAPPPRAGGL